MELPERIKEGRKKLNLSQDALANELHVSRQAISKWETGQSYPDLEKLIQLSDIFSLTLDELLRGDKRLEKKLINDGGGQTRIWGYLLIAVGILTGFWGGSEFPLSFMNPDFMSFLTGAMILIWLGILIIKDLPKRLKTGFLYLAALVTAIYMISLKMDLWVLLIGIVVEVGFVWWLAGLIRKRN